MSPFFNPNITSRIYTCGFFLILIVGIYNGLIIYNNYFQPAENVFVYSIKDCSNIRLVRNIYVDVVKLLPNKMSENVFFTTQLKKSLLGDIILYGDGSILTFQISNQFSYEKFMIAANWFVKNQDSAGGWPTNVMRKIYENVKLEPGWYSAMAQGHGLSLLTRAYHATKDQIYLSAASKALNLFETDTTNRGIRTHFLGQRDLVWYEEYPTSPSLLVLNGFMYSLFGLLDYSQSPGLLAPEAKKLLQAGVKSLQTLLPLFDSGFGSFYDLRHLTFPLANVKIHKKQIRPWEVHDGPNRARWEYHAVHIEQLLFLGHALEPSNQVLIDTAHRFTKYLDGFRSSHN